MLGERLRAAGFEVVATGGTTEAIELEIDGGPDMAVLDVDMPGRSTAEVARVVHAESPDTRVLSLDAYVRDA